MKASTIAFALLALLPAGPAAAEIGTIDDVPAATLLLPYFEVDLGKPAGVTTLFSVNNAAASAAVAHVTLWTDQAVPTLAFDVYLTGYDVRTINVRDLFNGDLPWTADAGVDTANMLTPQGALSQDVDFPGSTGPCAQPYPITGALDAARIDHLRKSHTGRFSATAGGCTGFSYGDAIARGYITVDSVTACTLLYPSDSAYWNGLADDRNILWGDYFYVSPAENFAAGETLVHIEACPAPSVGNGAGQCPFAAGDYTFYGRYRSAAGQDRREPLATSFAVRYVNAGAFDGGTQLVVWRDTKTRPPGSFGAHSCNFPPSWFPLDEGDAVALGEEETPVNLCSPGDAGIPVGGPVACFPLATQRISLRGGNLFGDDPVPFFDFGWMYLNLDHSLTAGDPYPGRAQAWVTALMSAEGRFEVGYDAVQVDSATSFPAHGFVIIP